MAYLERLLGKNEQVLFRTRQHFFIVFSAILREILILVVVGVGFFAVERWSPAQAPLFYIALSLVAIVALALMIIDILRWRSEEFLITNHRVIQCSGIFNKKVLDSSLNKINDVALQHTWLGRMFGYGTLEILTASEEAVNRIEKISRPIEFKQTLLEAKARSEQPAESLSVPRSATELLQELADLRAKNLVSDSEYEEKRKEILKRM
jgi:uncharacterized membrane protein YdbT with pleckstrin-like domain